MKETKRAIIGLFSCALVFLLAFSMPFSAAEITPQSAAKLQRLAELRGHTGPVFSLAFSADGKLLVSGGSATDHSVRVWDVSAGTQRALLSGNEKQVAAVGFSADGMKTLSAGYDYTIRIWDAARGQSVAVISRTAEEGLLSIENLVAAFSGDGRKFVYSNDTGQGPFVFDLATRKQRDLKSVVEGGEGSIGPIAIDGAGRLFAVSIGEQGMISLVDVEAGKRIGVLRQQDSPGGGAMALARDGSHLAVTNDATSTIQVFEVATAKPTVRMSGHKENRNGMLSITGLAFSPDGKLLASTSYDKTIRVWDVATGKALVTLDAAARKGPTTAAWSPDQMLLATADLDGTISLWGLR